MRPGLLPATGLALIALLHGGSAWAATCEAEAYDPGRPWRNPLVTCLGTVGSGDTILLHDGEHRALNAVVPNGLTLRPLTERARPVVVAARPKLTDLLAALGNLGRTYLLDGFDLFIVQEGLDTTRFEGLTFAPLAYETVERGTITVGRAVVIESADVVFKDCTLGPYDPDPDDGVDETQDIRLAGDAVSPGADTEGGVLAHVVGSSEVRLEGVTIEGIRGRSVDGVAVFARGRDARIVLEGANSLRDSDVGSGLIAAFDGAGVEVSADSTGAATTFDGLSGRLGSALFASDGATLLVKDGTFTNNGRSLDASGIRLTFGGHLAARAGSVVTIDGGTFAGGGAAAGGAFAILDARLVMRGGTFEGQHRARNGGLIAVAERDGATDEASLYLEGVELVGGTADLLASERGVVVDGEELAASGGAIFAATSDLELVSVSATGNSVFNPGAGGGLAAVRSDVGITGGTFAENTAAQGGALAMEGGSLRVDGTVFDGNGASNSTARGGAIATLDASVTLDGVLVSNNAADVGAGLFLVGGGTVTLADTDLVGNEGQLGAGALWVGEKLVMDRGLVSGNTATETGGGLLLLSAWDELGAAYRGEAALSGVTFTDNQAEDGGGLAVESVDLVGTTLTLEDNRALQAGGGILHLGSFLSVQDSVLVGNEADVAGGAVWSRSGEVSLLTSVLADNMAADGAALDLLDSTAHQIRFNGLCVNAGASRSIVRLAAPDGVEVPQAERTVITNNLVDQAEQVGGPVFDVGQGRFEIAWNHVVRADGESFHFRGAQVGFHHNVVAFNDATPALRRDATSELALARNVFFGRSAPEDVIGQYFDGRVWLGREDVSAAEDPRLRGYLGPARPDTPCAFRDHHPRPDSALIVDYDGWDTDPTADHAGIWGGPGSALPAWTTDVDGDRVQDLFDCDDQDEGIGDRLEQWIDADGDGVGGEPHPGFECVPVEGRVLVGGDCDDGDPARTDDCGPDEVVSFYGARCSTLPAGRALALSGVLGLLVLLRRRRRHADARTS